MILRSPSTVKALTNFEQILLFNSFPSLKARFIAYGSRATSTTTESTTKKPKNTESDTLRKDNPPSDSDHPSRTGILDSIGNFKVPHVYFTHFYIVSVVSSIFWLEQLLSRGLAFEWISSRTNISESHGSMSFNQIILCWSLLTLQGLRRLYESIILARTPSRSTMWFGHYLLGVAYYLAMCIAIWVEGLRKIIATLAS